MNKILYFPYSFPQQLREVAGVMELIHENQKEWNCDLSNITIMGFSAGGQSGGTIF